MTNKISSFRGKNYFLSNFYPCMVELDGQLYPSVEHAFQAAKTLDRDERTKFQVIDSPAMAKHLGRHIGLRDDWENVKLDIMYHLVYDKFTRTDPFPNQHDLQVKLLSTGDTYIEEGNRHEDRFWGTVNGVGQNNLGKIIMKVRDEIHEDTN